MAAVVPSVSGTSMRDFTGALRQIYGDEWVRAGLARLDAERRLEVEQAGAILWVPLETLRLAVDAWSEASGVSALEITRRGVQISVKTSFATVWRILLTVTSDSALITRTPLIWSKTRNVGRMTAAVIAEGHGRLTLTEFPSPTERQIYSVAVAIETFFDLTGRKGAKCKFQRKSDGAIFDVTF